MARQHRDEIGMTEQTNAVSRVSTNIITFVIVSVLGLAAVVIVNRSQLISLVTQDVAIDAAARTALIKHDELEERVRQVEQVSVFTRDEAHEMERYLRQEMQGEIKMLREHLQALQDRVVALEIALGRSVP
jgi:hypothetical protein